MGSNVPEQITVPSINLDGTTGETTWNVFSMNGLLASAYHGSIMASAYCTLDDAPLSFPKALKMENLSPFKCPCCNGNSYKEVGNKIICEYCGTEFLEK